MRNVISRAAVLLTLIFLCACGVQDAQTPEPEPEPSETAAPAPSPVPTSYPVKSPAPSKTPPPSPTPGPVRNPLTGLPLENEDHLGRRPVAVMLNNIIAALPQYGVTQADIIYEAPAEGCITRMVALYQDISRAGDIGSVRSTRSYYLDIAQGHDAILLHSGASPQAYSDIRTRGVTNIDGIYNSAIYWRDQARIRSAGLEHSLFTSGELTEDYLLSQSFRLEHNDDYVNPLLFVENGTPEGGFDAKSVTVRYSDYKTGTFDYDETNGLYAVGQYGREYIDGANGLQVRVTNVLVLEASVYQIRGDDAGRLSINLTGTGSGKFFCGGKGVDITWRKDSADAPFEYCLENGDPLEFGRGKSYINIASAGSQVTVR